MHLNIRIYVLCHTQERFTQAQTIYKAYTWAIPILMKYQNVTFENAFWKQLLEIKEEWQMCDMVGTLSYSAYKKINIAKMDRILHDRTQWSCGYYNFYDTNIPLSNEWHPNMLEIVDDVCASISMKKPSLAYCNYWMCTPSKMMQFIPWVLYTLIPAVMAHPLSMKDSTYPFRRNDTDLMNVCGVPYYPYVPFVIERLNKGFFMQSTVAVVSVFKNEAHILEEWIEHYRKEGVLCFFLTDNGSTDHYMSKLRPYIEKGIVVLRVDPARYKQIDHMNTFLEVAKQFDWILPVDLDECLYARNGFGTIRQYLQSLDSSIGTVSVPWKMFGSNGHTTQPTSVIQGFTRRMDTTIAKQIEHKTIVRSSVLISFGIHDHHTKPCTHIFMNRQPQQMIGYQSLISECILAESCLHLNHYAIQSWEYFSTVKMTRGDATTIHSDHVRNEQYFKRYDHNDIEDTELQEKRKCKCDDAGAAKV